MEVSMMEILSMVAVQDKVLLNKQMGLNI